jgi:predicted PurR-regulated permease PerM
VKATGDNWARTVATSFLILAMIVVAAAVVWLLRGIVITVLVAVVCAYVLRPAVESFRRLRLRLGDRAYSPSRSVATTLVFLSLILILWGIWGLSAPSLGREAGELQARWPRYRTALLELAARGDQYYREQLPDPIRRSVDSWVQGTGDLLTSTARRGVRLTVQGVNLIIELLLVPILAFYFLADGPAIRRQCLVFIPPRYCPKTERAFDQADDIFQRYIRGQVILCAIAFAVVALGLWALRVDFYLLLGIVAGLTRAVPILGPVVGGIPIIIVLLLTKSTGLALWVLLLLTIMHLLESKLLMPAILGQQLDLHPVLIIVALLIGAQMGGLLGIFLATPVLAAIKTVVTHQRQSAAAPTGSCTSPE